MKKISTKVSLIIGGCICVVVLLLGYLSMNYSSRLMQQEAEEKLVWMARDYADRFSQEFLMIENQVEEIASYLETTIDLEKLYSDPSYLVGYEEKLSAFLYLFAKDRTQGTAAWCYFNPELSNMPLDVYYADGDKDGIPERQAHIPFSYYDNIATPTDDKYWWYGPVESGKLCWTNPYEWALLNNDIIKVSSCAKPVILNGKLIAVVGTYYHFDQLRADVEAIQVYDSGYAALLNEKLDFIVHPSFRTGTRNNSDNLATVLDGVYAPAAKAILDNEFGLSSLPGEDETLMAYSHLSNGWVLAVLPPVSEVYEGLDALLRILLTAVGICMLLAVLVSWVMGKLIARPILKIANACQQLGDGNLSVRVDMSTRDETKLLADSFNQMADNIGSLNEELTALAYYDTLTGIANKHLFEKTASRLLNHAPVPYAYILFDVSKFKLINDTFGLEQGDRLLLHISQVLSESGNPSEICARIVADQFHMLLCYDNAQALEDRLREMGERICSYQFALNPEYKLSVGFGIYLIEDRQLSICLMGDKANLALAKGKQQHSLSICFYKETILNQIIEEQQIENAMEGALRDGEFQLYLQPKYNFRTGCIVGAEVLTRWKTADHGLLFPSVFIPVFEKNGFIADLDRYMLDRLCALLRRRIDLGLPVVPISINQSRQYLNQPGYLSTLLDIVGRYSIPHHLVELEITETAFFDHQEEMVGLVKQLHDLGFLVSMDDFGSGYSSLNMLQDILVDVLKLDRIFFRDSIYTQRGQKIVSNIIAMAQELGIAVVAEGIETQEQIDFLAQTSCSVIQGYFFDKPLPADVFEQRCNDLPCEDFNH